MADQALTVCPKEHCPGKRWGKGKVRRVISGGAGLLFKGSGFYITDYRSESYKQAASKDQASSTPAKTETKPASGATSGTSGSSASTGSGSGSSGSGGSGSKPAKT
jgi:predicted nucleic acid-binding Zn ribbon protein